MEIRVEPIPIEQKPVLRQLLELYVYDFSLYLDLDVDECGFFGYSYLDDYWSEDGRFPYLIRADGKIAGFVLVHSCCEFTDLPDPHHIAEFFVLQKYRRRGVGRSAAAQVFDRHRGGWEVTQITNNIPAQKFWGAVIRAYTGGKFETFGPLAPDSSGKVHVGFTFRN